MIPLCDKSRSSLGINTSIRIHFATAGGGKHLSQDPPRHGVPSIEIHPPRLTTRRPSHLFISSMYTQVTPRSPRRRRVAKWVKASLWLNPFSTGTHFRISSAYLSILYSFRNSWGEQNGIDSGHYYSDIPKLFLMSIKPSNHTLNSW